MADPADVGLAFESVQLTTDDGQTLDAWFIPSRNERGVVLFFHGNAGNISHRLESIGIFHRLGLLVLILDYRGYGRSTGSPSEEGTYRDALAAWEWLTGDRGVPPGRVVLFGRSLGGAVAAWLATRTRPAGLIVESTFRSVPALASELYPFLPVRALARLDYDAEATLAQAGCPTLIVHSVDDEIIPYEHGRALHAAARDPRGLVTLSGGHNDGFLLSRDVYLRGLDAFFEELGLTASREGPSPAPTQ